MKKRIKSNKVQTSIIELICIIVIIFVIITIGLYAINELSQTSNNNTIIKQENIIIDAINNYLLNKEEKIPKRVGQSKKISLNELKQENFLKNDIVNDEKKSCMNNSYVIIYKDSNNNYQYTPFIYCDNEDDNKSSDGMINLFFADVKKDSNTYDITNSSFTIELSGGNTPQNTPLRLESYKYTISLLNDSNKWDNVYESNIIEVNTKNPVIYQEKINKYIKQSKIKDILIHVEIQNNTGRIITKDFTL